MVKPCSIALMTMLLAEPAFAETPTLLLFRDVSPPQLWIYDADSCDEVSAAECTLIAMQCESIGNITINVNGLDDGEIAQWKKDGDTLRVTGIPGLSTLTADDTTMSDFDGLWSLGFRSSYQRPAVDGDLFGPELAFEVIYGSIIVPLDDDTANVLRAFLSGCGI